MARYEVGMSVPKLELQTIKGQSLRIPQDSSPWLHIQFRRFAGCPICNLHLRTMIKRYEEIRTAGICELVFFHSTAESMLPYQGDMPFACVADPNKTYYKQFGVETSLLGTLHPKNLWAVIKGLCSQDPSHLTAGDEAGHLGMPADFLVNQNGKIIAVKYGKFADDQWSVDELLALTK